MSLVVVGYVAIAIWRAFVIVPIESGAEPESTSVSELKSGRLERPKAPRNDFVGSATCAECHPKIAESYRSHSMANSLWEAASAPEIEDYADRNTFSPDGRHSYSVEKTSEGVFHHERL